MKMTPIGSDIIFLILSPARISYNFSLIMIFNNILPF